MRMCARDCRALDIKAGELSQHFEGDADVPAQLLLSLAGVCGTVHRSVVVLAMPAAAPMHSCSSSSCV
jgi:hypothetical protein